MRRHVISVLALEKVLGHVLGLQCPSIELATHPLFANAILSIGLHQGRKFQM